MLDRIAVFTIALTISGCSTHPTVNIDLAESQNEPFIEDRRETVDYPGFATGEGNIYSCHFAIHLYNDNEIIPDPVNALQASLEDNFYTKDQEIILERFEIYSNWQERLRKVAIPGVLAGPIGVLAYEMMTKEAQVTPVGAVTTLDGKGAKKKGKVLGCKGANQGEYYREEIPEGYSAIVAHLDVIINNTSVKIRSVYPVLEKEVALDQRGPYIESALEALFDFLSDVIEVNALLKSK